MDGRRRRLRKLRIAAAFRSSLSSCSSRNLSHSLLDSVFLPQPQPHGHRPSLDDHLPDLSFLNTSNASSCGMGFRHNVAKCASEMMLPSQILDRYPPTAKEDSRHVLRCPPASPITPLNPFLQHRLTPARAAEACESSSSSASLSAAAGLFLSSSDVEGDEGTSSECSFSKMMTGKLRGKEVAESSSSSYAVIKRSRDPYGDFRSSMVEMIVEKKMYGAGELERLLEWFLRLNEGSHHAVILRAFTDVWESLHYM